MCQSSDIIHDVENLHKGCLFTCISSGELLSPQV